MPISNQLSIPFKHLIHIFVVSPILTTEITIASKHCNKEGTELHKGYKACLQTPLVCVLAWDAGRLDAALVPV